MKVTRRNLVARLVRKLLVGSASVLLGAAAVQPVQAQTYCPIKNRECLVFIANMTTASQSYAQQKFYKFVEIGAQKVALSILGPRYNKVHVVSGPPATRAMLTKMLKGITAKSSVRALDLIFVTHGLSNKVMFSDASVSMSSVRTDIRAQLSSYKRKKLRMVFSTACYGSSHRAYWIGAGFKVASGSSRIYADSGTSYQAFLRSWAGVNRFHNAVGCANSSDPARLQDGAAKILLRSWGYPKWADVNSYRYTSGVFGMRITHRPY